MKRTLRELLINTRKRYRGQHRRKSARPYNRPLLTVMVSGLAPFTLVATRSCSEKQTPSPGGVNAKKKHFRVQPPSVKTYGASTFAHDRHSAKIRGGNNRRSPRPSASRDFCFFPSQISRMKPDPATWRSRDAFARGSPAR